MKDELLTILRSIRPDVAFESEQRLIDDGILDSFDIISIIGEFNDAFGVEIDAAELEAENFNTVEAMLSLIEKLQNE